MPNFKLNSTNKLPVPTPRTSLMKPKPDKFENISKPQLPRKRTLLRTQSSIELLQHSKVAANPENQLVKYICIIIF